jgi:threonyl-tRNA synthetase
VVEATGNWSYLYDILDARFERVELSRADALAMASRGELGALGARPEPSKFKLDIIQNIPESETITIYRNGDFTDLCAGPHVMRTGNIGAFRLTNVASAYYKGDEKNPQLQRIYGTAFKNKTELEAYFQMLEEAKRRDHRKIGAEMGLYAIDTEFVGPGLPLWLPKGAAIAEALEKLAKESEFAAGYVQVKSPHIAKEKLYLTSGHLPLLYADSMYPPMELDGEKYYLKSMNCPHHHKIYAAEPKSYRDLPYRIAEYGTVYRYEQSGELFGLMRVRCLHMNDAHIYCTKEQFNDEFRAVNNMYLKYFKIFGIEKYVMRLSLHSPEKLGVKSVNHPELWKETETMNRS